MEFEENNHVELLEKLRNLKTIIVELTQKINNLNERLKTNPMDVEKGISFLDIKNSLLFEYDMYIAYYCWLKSSGDSVARHNAIQRLIYLRICLERCKPIEKKLYYQIEKLLKETQVDESLNAKPNVDDLVVSKNEDGVFKPTVIAGKRMEGIEDVQDEEDDVHQEAIEEMENEVDDDIDTPMEIGFDGNVVLDKKQVEKEREIREYEEETHHRLSSKKNKPAKLRDEFGDLMRFVGNLSKDLMKEYKEKRLKGEIVDDDDEIDSEELEGLPSDDSVEDDDDFNFDGDDEEINSDDV